MAEVCRANSLSLSLSLSKALASDAVGLHSVLPSCWGCVGSRIAGIVTLSSALTKVMPFSAPCGTEGMQWQ